MALSIRIAGIFVDDQEKALKFYTDVLGFLPKVDIPLGEDRWLTVVSRNSPHGTELLLEPNKHEAARAYQRSIRGEGIAATLLFCDNIEEEVSRLKEAGVRFVTEPVKAGNVTIAVFDDTCGNLIQLVQE